MAVLPIGIGSATNGGYQIERSLRFNSADSANLSRTPASVSADRTRFTFSCWLKRGSLTDSGVTLRLPVFGAGPSSGQYTQITTADGSGALKVELLHDGAVKYSTLAVLRDPSAWCHLVVQGNSNETVTNRIKIWINNVQYTTSVVSEITSADVFEFGNTVAHYVGKFSWANYYFDGYLTEINFIDGQAKTPSDFGETDSNTGVWKPKAYSGTYGTNGFYLKFADNSGTTSTTLGKDSSGNGNNWTPNNFYVGPGTTNAEKAGIDSLVDTPTSYGTDTGVGGEVRGNYCTLNPVKYVTNSITYSNGNLQYKPGSSYSTTTYVEGTIGVLGGSTGKYYWEISSDQAGNLWTAGVALQNNTVGSSNIGTTGSVMIYNTSKYVNGTETAGYSTQIAANGVLGIALDAATGKVWFRNSTGWFGSGDPAAGTNETGIITGFSGGTLVPVTQANSASTVTANFGQRSFSFTAPSGFKALCTQNLSTPTIGATSTTQANDYMNVVLYTGTGSSLGVTGVGFQPDLVWIKGRSGATDHGWYDAVRGVQKQLESNTTTAETTETTGLTAFGTDGFTVGALAQLNTNTATYVAWNWNAGGSNQTISVGQYATSPANVPSIASTVRANTTSGFSIVSFAFPAVASKTVGHGLGVAPSMVIVKSRSNGTQQWITYHASSGNTGFLCLNKTDAFSTNSTVWDNTSPTSTVFTLGSGFTSANFGADGIAYCFADVDGYSKAFSYVSNNSADNAFVYLGFRPRWIMIKSSSTGGVNYDWVIYDTARMTYNYIANTDLRANLTTTEGGTARNPAIDILSNGFKVRSSAGEIGSSTLYVGMAFAETPFKYALAR